MAKNMHNARGRARAEHFANGGTLAGWRGRPVRFNDAKKAANKNACRSKPSAHES